MNKITQENLTDYKYCLKNNRRNEELYKNIDQKGITQSI